MENHTVRTNVHTSVSASFGQALIALVAAGWLGSAGATVNFADAAAFRNAPGPDSVSSYFKAAPAPSRIPSGCLAGSEHHGVPAQAAAPGPAGQAPKAPTVQELRPSGEMTQVDHIVVLLAGLVGAGGIPLAWQMRRRLSRVVPVQGVASRGLTRIMIFGTGDKAREVQLALAKSDCPVDVVGFYPSQQEEECLVSQHLVLSAEKSLTETAHALGVDEIVVAVMQRRGGVMPMRELLDCRLAGIRVRDLASHFEHWLGQIRLDSLKPGWMIFSDGFQQGFFRMAIKTLFDVVCSGILLVMTMPVMLAAAIAIKLESRGPVFYRQERVGLNGTLFNVIKFRSMRTDAEKDGRPRWAQVGDTRITRVGRILRKLRIDELPQLFSVFAGHMSLVGPRPERAYFVDQLTKEIPYYNVRHSIKPGVTGWAQVRYHYGASVEDAAEKLQYDLYYVKNHSLLLDLKVLLGTVSVVLLAKGA